MIHALRRLPATPSSDVSSTTIHLVCFFFMLVSAAIAVLVALSRNVWPEPGAISISLAWLHFAAVISAWLLSTKVWSREPMGACWQAVLATIFVLALPTLAGGSSVTWWLITLLTIMIVLLGVFDTCRLLRKIPARQTIYLACAAALIGLLYFLWINSKGYSTVLNPELAMLGYLHSDTLAHVAISSMLSQHGVASTGVNGLTPVHYHILSHFWIGRTSQWLLTTPLHGYYLVPQIVALPLMLFALVASVRIYGDTDGSRSPRIFETLSVPIALLLIFAIGDFTSYLTSESHMLAIILYMIGLPLLLQHARDPGLTDLNPRILVIILLGIAISLSKISVGAIWFSGVGYIYAHHTLSGWRNRANWPQRLLLVLTALASFSALALVITPDVHLQYFKIAPFQFFRDFWMTAGINTVAVAAGCAIAARRWKENGPDVPTGTIGVLMVSAWLGGMIGKIDGGSAYYFINIGTWVAITVIARHILLLSSTLPTARVRWCAGGVMALAVAVNPQAASSYKKFNNVLITIARHVAAPAPSIGVSSSVLAKQIAKLPGVQLFGLISKNLEFGKRSVAIFIPPDNQSYWDLSRTCLGKSLILPAVTGIPMINGFPPSHLGCQLSPNYGIDHFVENAQNRVQTNIELCTSARDRGFRHVAIVSSVTMFQLLECS